MFPTIFFLLRSLLVKEYKNIPQLGSQGDSSENWNNLYAGTQS